jgi:uncharacterized protein
VDRVSGRDSGVPAGLLGEDNAHRRADGSGSQHGKVERDGGEVINAQIQIPRETIESFCRRWQIVELALFGSALRDDFGPDSDVDVLVRFAPDARHTLFDLVHMQDELSSLFGRDVDVVEKTAMERSRNLLRRKAILETAEILYAD